MRIVVCDTGPVLHLREAGVLDVLRHAGEVLIPAAVDDELARLIDDWLLTDDAEARIIAGLAGLEVHGSLGVLLWTAAQRHLEYAAADAALTRLAQSSLWLSPAILSEARTALRKLGSRP